MEINPCKLSVPLKRTGRTWIIEEFYEKESECVRLYENLSLVSVPDELLFGHCGETIFCHTDYYFLKYCELNL